MSKQFCMHCFDSKEIKNIIIEQGFIQATEIVCEICHQKIESNSFQIQVDILAKKLHKIFGKLYEFEEYLAKGHWSHYDRLDSESGYIKSSEDVFNELFHCQNPKLLFHEFEKIDEIFLEIDIDSSCWKSICGYGIKSVHEGWAKFSYNVKHKARFFNHPSYSVTEELERFNNFFKQAEFLTSKQNIYRARLIDENLDKQEATLSKIYKEPLKELGKVPLEHSQHNRFSPIGISYGYYSYDKETTLAEIRASLHNTVVIGTFILKDNLNLVDLQRSNISKFNNPFLDTFDFTIYCNQKFIENFTTDISKARTPTDTLLGYIPTQIMSEYIWSLGYDGFVFDSSQYSNGSNIVIFEENLELLTYNVIEIEKKNTRYSYKVISEKANLNGESLNKNEECATQDDEPWMEKIWSWADDLKVSEKVIPRNKKMLLNLETFIIDPGDCDYPVYDDYTQYLFEISFLYNLKKVSLGNMNIDTFHKSNTYLYTNLFKNLNNLQELTFFGLELHKIPNVIKNTDNLILLDISASDLKEVDKNIAMYSNLRTLNLVMNKFTNLPKELCTLKHLEKLNLSSNELTELPNNFGDLQNLKILNLNYNNLTSLPDSIIKLTKLSELGLSHNTNLTLTKEQKKWIMDLQNNGCKCPSVWMIKLWTWAAKNLIHEKFISPYTTDFSTITTLQINNDNIKKLPKELLNLTSLTHLRLNCHSIGELPKILFDVVSLEHLELENTHFSHIPKEIEKLINLRFLSINNSNAPNTRLSILPNEIGKLKNLEKLRISGLVFATTLSKIPTTIGLLTNLKVLDLSNNRIESLPEEIGNLTKLSKLDLKNNQLTSLPNKISKLRNIKELDISANRNLQLSKSQKDWVDKLLHKHGKWKITTSIYKGYESHNTSMRRELGNDTYDYGYIPDSHSKGWD